MPRVSEETIQGLPPVFNTMKYDLSGEKLCNLFLEYADLSVGLKEIID
jgi:hypothetical protein